MLRSNLRAFSVGISDGSKLFLHHSLTKKFTHITLMYRSAIFVNRHIILKRVYVYTAINKILFDKILYSSRWRFRQ